MEENSIFKELFSIGSFIDRYVEKKEDPVDVIVPIINTNELFVNNLHSWYKEIPINRLLIGYGGGTDNSLNEVKKFPRVVIIDQSKKYSDHLYGSQGICIAELISNVNTEWFIYLHADVFLPNNWYDIMKAYQDKYDWFECRRDIITLIKFKHEIDDAKRAYSGSQMGRKEAFKNIVPIIEDGYLQNNEDIIFQELILDEGYRYGRVLETKHYHQLMDKRGEKEPKYKEVIVKRDLSKQWTKNIYDVQIRGIIKYCKPKRYLIHDLNKVILFLYNQNDLDLKNFKKWVKETNKDWLPFIKVKKSSLYKVLEKLQKLINNLFNKMLV